MTPIPKRRWYQFGLKTLLLIMTLAAVVAWRVSFLQQRAEYHRLESQRASEEQRGDYYSVRRTVEFHRAMTIQYSNAAYRPWTFVDDTPDDALIRRLLDYPKMADESR